MTLKIDGDLSRFQRKLKDMKKDGLRKYFNSDELAVPGKDGILRIPAPRIDIPNFRFGRDKNGEEMGVGQGEGEEGDIFHGPERRGQGGGHGEGKGEHDFLELTREEVAELLGEHLKLPNLRDLFSSGGNIEAIRTKLRSISPVGPNSLRHFRRTYVQALKRAIASGEYDPLNPVVIPRREDMRFRAPVDIKEPNNRAAIVYLMDCSGSMYDVIGFLQLVGWFLDSWITRHYSKIDRRYLTYEWEAEETTSDRFFTIGAGGGTSMLSGLELTRKIAKAYGQEWDLYLVHFTDGDRYGVSREEFEEYAEFLGRESPGRGGDGFVGNPLFDFIIPRFNALFVCEAGAYYEGENYSELLGQLIRERPDVEKKVRAVSYESRSIVFKPNELAVETLECWLGNDSRFHDGPIRKLRGSEERGADI